MTTPTLTPRQGRWERPPLGPVWRRFLGSGNADVAELRRWAWWSWWATHATALSKLKAARELLGMPRWILRESRKAVATYGPKVAEKHGVSLRRQLAQLMWLWAARGVRPLAYYRFQLFRPDRWQRADQFLQVEEAEDLIRIFTRRIPDAPDRFAFVDKRVFQAFCREHGLPCVGTVLEFEGGRVVGDAGRALPPCDLFSKPTNWQGGSGAHRWRYAVGRYQGSSGRGRTADELVAELERASAETGRPFVLQRALTNHAALRPLTPGGLCTVRLVTVRPDGAAPRPLLAVYRMPTGSTPADNFDLGGLASPIDLTTGRLGPAVQKRGAYPVDEVTAHPDTGATIAGRHVPFWPEVIRMGLRAHELVVARVPIAGWDIAVCDDGPIFIEANNLPCSILSQMSSGQPLGGTAYASCLAAALRDAFGVLPPRAGQRIAGG